MPVVGSSTFSQLRFSLHRALGASFEHHLPCMAGNAFADAYPALNLCLFLFPGRVSHQAAKNGCGSKPMGSHFGVGAPPILVYSSRDWDVHWVRNFDPWPNQPMWFSPTRSPPEGLSRIPPRATHPLSWKNPLFTKVPQPVVPFLTVSCWVGRVPNYQNRQTMKKGFTVLHCWQVVGF